MAETTEISWAHSTFNPWIGCTKVSPGCDHCYAERDMAIRRKRVTWGPGALRSRTSEAYWRQPLRWNREAAASGKPWRVFCASLADVFDNEVPGEWLEELFELIRVTPALTWLLLTKRPQNIERFVAQHGAIAGNGMRYLPDNVWLGTTVCDQAEADRNIPVLLRCKASLGARLLWLSIEPMLGPVGLRDPRNNIGEPRYSYLDEELESRIGWVIVGGESGPHARPLDPAWARSVRDQCAHHDVPFHFKQWGGARPKAGGHLLDGVEHRAFPA